MRRHVPPTTFLPIILASAAALAPGPSAAQAPGVKAPLPTEARRYIAVVVLKPDGTASACPMPTNVAWKSERLFQDRLQRKNQVRPLRTLPPALDRFCLYTSESPRTAPVFPLGTIVRGDFDLDTLLPQGATPVTDLTASAPLIEALTGDYRVNMGAEPVGLGQQVYDAVQNLAQVAVIDTAGGSQQVTDGYPLNRPEGAAGLRYEHGLAMAEIIGDVRCAGVGDKCRNYTFFSQAFPYTHAAKTAALLPSSAAPLGSMGSLSQAIFAALTRWRETWPVNGHPAPLIVNLSLGWESTWGPLPAGHIPPAGHTELVATPSPNISAGVQAVHTALVHASCLEVLAIAAAGNNTDGGCGAAGALAPAAWEVFDAPDRSRCEALFGAAELAPARAGHVKIKEARRALVYAAGGVVPGGALLPISRLTSTPPRLAAASHAIAGIGPRQTDAWAGTSVASAGVAGLAATMWSHQLVLTPHEVMHVLDSSGVATTLPVALKPDGTPAAMARRVSGAAAFQWMTAKAPVAWQNPYRTYVPPNPAAQITSALAQLQATIPNAAALNTGQAETEAFPMSCAKRTHYYKVAMGQPRPRLSLKRSPWLRPQPETPICPICPVKGGKLIVTINKDHEAQVKGAGGVLVLQDPVLEFRGPAGYVAVSLGTIRIVNGTSLEIDLSQYEVQLNKETQPLDEALATGNITAGTLTVFAPAGTTTGLVSVVEVYP